MAEASRRRPQLHYGADHTVDLVDSLIIKVIKPVDAENLSGHRVSIQHQAVVISSGDAAQWAICIAFRTAGRQQCRDAPIGAVWGLMVRLGSG